jgi:hypothetical protein
MLVLKRVVRARSKGIGNAGVSLPTLCEKGDSKVHGPRKSNGREITSCNGSLEEEKDDHVDDKVNRQRVPFVKEGMKACRSKVPPVPLGAVESTDGKIALASARGPQSKANIFSLVFRPRAPNHSTARTC